MSKINYIIPILLCFLSLTACQQDEYMVYENEKIVNVRLNIGGLATNKSQAITRYVDASQYEGLRTLRIIVTDEAMTKVHYNEEYTVEPSNSINQSITIPNIPVGKAFFYVIANEKSLGKTYTTAELMKEITNKKLLFKDEEWKYFPQKGPDIETNGLPMSGKADADISPENNTVNVKLTRAVTKILLTVENTTSSAITLKDINFGSFFGDRMYVFAEQDLDVPDDTQYTSMKFENIGLYIDANSSSPKLSLYLYPTYAQKTIDDNPYELGISTTNYTYKNQPFAPGINSFSRNTQINIRARITTTVGLQIDYAVQPWDEYSVDVPEFN